MTDKFMVSGAYCDNMERDIPTCDGCGAKGYYLCDDCRTPDHEVEAINQNVRRPSHNDTNFPEW